MSLKKVVKIEEKKTPGKLVQLWYGDDESLLEWEAAHWRTEFIKRQPQGRCLRLSYDKANEQEQLLKLRQAVWGGNLFGAAVYLELSNFSQTSVNSALAKLIRQLIEMTPTGVVVVLIETNHSSRAKAFFKELKNLGEQGKLTTREFVAATSLSREKWLLGLLKNQSVIMPVGSVRLLIQRAGLDCWRLQQEINKLTAYCGKRPVTAADIDLLVEPIYTDTAFALLEATGKHNLNQAMTIMTRQLNQGISPQSLIGMLAWHLRVLTSVRQALNNNPSKNAARQLSQELKLHPFVISKALRQMPYYSQARLNELWRELTQTDLKLKTSSVPAAAVLSLFLAKLTKLSLPA